MKGRFRFRIAGILLLAAVLSALPARGEERQGTGAETPRLKMEELEVRGKRGTPEVLYFPAPEGIYFLSPVRFDLIREKLIREEPIRPEEGNSP